MEGRGPVLGVSAPILPVSQPGTPQLQRDFSLSNTFEGTASARRVSPE